VIKSNFITSIFQNFIIRRDIRQFKKSLFYYILFRLIRNFLMHDIILKIYNFKISGSIKKNKTSYFLLKKCEFGDYDELNTIKNFSNNNKLILIDCGCNYGFYSFYTSSLSPNNIVISIEASKNTSNEFIRNLKLNNISNINFFNKAVSNIDDQNITFYESKNDWESSQTHSNFEINSKSEIKSIKIDSLLKQYTLENYSLIIKLDIEGNEVNAIKGAIDLIEEKNPLIIIEFSKYIFDDTDNIDYLNSFLLKYDYSIYDTKKNKKNLSDVLLMIKNLKQKRKTIGNFYLIKNSSNYLKTFLSNE